MLISTKGRYALRVMVDLAENYKCGYIPLKDIASRQEISLKYLESIMVLLSKSGLIDGAHGKGGGYRLNRDPKDYKIGEIIKIADGTLAPVACLEENAPCCKRADKCKTLPLWKGLDKVVSEYLNSFTLYDMIEK